MTQRNFIGKKWIFGSKIKILASILPVFFVLPISISTENNKESSIITLEPSINQFETPHLKRNPQIYSFGLGKKSSPSGMKDVSTSGNIDNPEHQSEDFLYSLINEEIPMYETKKSGKYGFGLGKRESRYAFGLGKKSHSGDGSRYGFGLGKRYDGEMDFESEYDRDNIGSEMDKRRSDDQGRFGFGLGKRQDDVNRFAFGLGKRPDKDSRFNFGIGKRDNANRFAFGLGKRPSDESRFSFGLGKRLEDDKNRFSFGLGKRRDDANRYAFGLGKRQRNDDDLDDFIKRRFSFGLGKRSVDSKPNSIEIQT